MHFDKHSTNHHDNDYSASNWEKSQFIQNKKKKKDSFSQSLKKSNVDFEMTIHSLKKKRILCGNN